jgi:activator of 2-hydroxyglutaryl-CoA dehydratase
MDVVPGALAMTGGVVSYNPALVRMVEEAFGRPVLVPPDPQFIGALGAALFAAEMEAT